MSSFDKKVDRTGFASVKQAKVPACVTESGIMSLWGAEFEYPTAPFVTDAIVEWAKKGLYAYTVDDDSFHELVKKWMKIQRNWEIRKEWIVPTYGITSSLATCVRAFTQENDGIIGMTPGYHMYWKAIELSGRKKVATELLYRNGRYEIDWKDLELKMAEPANKMLVLCNPHNPVGRVWNREEQLRIGKLAEKYGIIIFSDEIFGECLYDGVEMVTLNQIADSDVKVIVATSLGKWLSFTGTNQANMIIPDDSLREAFLAQRDREFYGSMNPMMLPAYYAAYTEQGRQWLREMMAYVQENYRMTAEFFDTRIPQFKAVRPEGTYILWVDCTALGMDDEQLQQFLFQKAHFHVDYGTCYGGHTGFFRMTLSVPRAELYRALCSLEQAVKDIS
ncbi:MAG: aminotransferase class I/II-fold pyridoxal phosphate-dependent enzyme [Candidatus Choladocola sp.]|nr:aminotransferase class I/II-fold pyridoxal phosphate-dependent enzyme [Candidatus Choladocola sp.]